jgi:hypothetical protein
MIVLVPSFRVLEAWPMVNGHIDRALEHAPDWMTGIMVYEALAAGHAQLALLYGDDQTVRWTERPKPLGTLVLEVRQYAGPKLVTNVWAFGGEPGIWKAHQVEIEAFLDAWSSAHGCDTIMMQGRPGWQKLLSDDWRFRPVVEAQRPVRNPGHGIHAFP